MKELMGKKVYNGNEVKKVASEIILKTQYNKIFLYDVYNIYTMVKI